MVRFTVTFLIMIVLFLGGVLVGMNQASIGMIQMRGFSNGTFQEAVQTEKLETGDYEVQVLGRDFQQVSVQEKQQQYQEHNEARGLQKVAVMLEKAVNWAYNTVIYTIYHLFQVFF
ncbi:MULTISPECIES: DUF3679 domain-containing protein [Pontibacillus]|uniref:DUF3679 domain-containing protein n=1 Tax=Pontibacillus chungwhensis TaxID=265426 RepID=A0ABY8UX54_9BACI|nr:MULTISPECIES: DUF3679 domain-containing protein [Pontibacillus]MCD5323633.1 YqxA family protein [Pontibacillus sp. HN14]WIF97000.1 DUF3679 domain-containing protein [Pontibacillus chungwhensis]